MKDRFKFRAFDKKINAMRDVHALTPFGVVVSDLKTENIRIPFENCVVMQSTGLKDKKGTLIFEGDVVKTTQHQPYRKKIAVIQYHTCFFSADFTEIDKFYDTGFSLTKDTTDFIDIEVIGNIYTRTLN